MYIEASGVDRSVEFRKRIIDLKRGQLVVSQRALAKRWKWHRTKAVRFLRKLEGRKIIFIETLSLSPPCSIITFLNYNELNPINKKNEK